MHSDQNASNERTAQWITLKFLKSLHTSSMNEIYFFDAGHLNNGLALPFVVQPGLGEPPTDLP